ncbi:MAG: ATP-binding cassette domain-containing protein, partial [Pseudonocardiales bacterium]|nr:ATP-binding cassette domain-containing protein [Pseudonocardiales bacterium]
APAPVADRSDAEDGTPPSALAAAGLAVRWPGAGRDAVTGVDLDLRPGGRLLLTGPSGSGKTSVVAALLRTLAPAAGRVLADGRDAAALTGDGVRRGVAWCGSWSHLFDSTLRANLQLAAPGADDADLVDALRRAQLGGWYAGLPDGLDTPLGAHGGEVSGGERQRLGIARALVADRPVLVLDEPTAHLDATTADALSGELRETTAGRTALLVTHRPGRLADLPRIHLPARRRDTP